MPVRRIDRRFGGCAMNIALKVSPTAMRRIGGALGWLLGTACRLPSLQQVGRGVLVGEQARPRVPIDLAGEQRRVVLDGDAVGP